MDHNWTMKELQEISDKNLILTLINERKNALNPYAPLAMRLDRLANWVEKNVPAVKG